MPCCLPDVPEHPVCKPVPTDYNAYGIPGHAPAKGVRWRDFREEERGDEKAINLTDH